ncbi:MAG: GMC family oxidoreductase [Actinobacteria bacterium]|nr:MAG: GMC family oxidoreductase [Actinomycetota bacterium]
MSKPSVIVVGSGAGGSVAAWVLARAGHPVLILEKGRNLLPGLGHRGRPGSRFGNDEVKSGRFFENQDPLLEPRAQRSQAEAEQGVAHSFVGDVNDLPTTVGGGTIHWDAKTPRFWRHDFKGLSMFGPVPGANVADWPLAYDELAPYYDRIERRLGVQGDVHRMPASTLAQAPRRHQFPMPPNPPMYAGLLFAEGARKLGYTAYPFPMAVNSRKYDGRPACNSCGFCSGFGCPINARGGAAVSFLHRALLHGAELRPRSFVYRVDVGRRGHRARGVSYLDAHGRRRKARADIVILAGSAIETARLLLMSSSAAHPHGLGNRSRQLGRNLMFHYFTLGVALFRENIHAWRGPSTTHTMDDFVGPVTGPDARAAGLPYFKGGICEVGASVLLLQEAQLYTALPNGWGTQFKAEMRDLALREHLGAIQLVGEDMPQKANRVDLHPRLRDVYGFPIPRITYSPHQFEMTASRYYAQKLIEVCQAAPGSISAGLTAVPLVPGGPGSGLEGPNSTAHIMGTARMGNDARTSVTDRFGRLHELENVYIGDGSVFTSSGGFNPTLTIMALSLRMAEHLAGARGGGVTDGRHRP